MDGTLQERGPRWHGLFAGHGAHGAGACRALRVEAEFRYPGQPGQHARTCPLNRQGTAAAAHPYACFSTVSCAPLQHLRGSKAHTQRYMHTHTHTHTYTHTHAHTHISTNAHTYTRTNTRVRTHTNAQSHRHTHAHTHILTRTRANACTRCARDGLRQFFSVASDAHSLVKVLRWKCYTPSQNSTQGAQPEAQEKPATILTTPTFCCAK